jgi:hypothetical protein
VKFLFKFLRLSALILVILSIIIPLRFPVPVYAAPIDIGSAAVDRDECIGGGATFIDLANPANDTGVITSVELWFTANHTGVKVGTFYGSGTDYTNRDFATIGNVTGGSKQTFSGLSIDVTSGDFIGVYYNVVIPEGLEMSTSGGTILYTCFGDQFGTGLQTYSSSPPGFALSLYGIGASGVSAPTVTVQSASNVEETTVTLTGNITATGGENADMRGFAWGTTSNTTLPTSGEAPPASYTSNWTETGSFGASQFTSSGNITGLSPGTSYYYRSYAHNSSGWGWSTQDSFHTKPEVPTGFTCTAGDTEIILNWAKGTGAEYTYVRYKAGAYPANIADGTLSYNGTLLTYTQGGLINGTDYYFRAWAWSSDGGTLNQYSDATADCHNTPIVPTVSTLHASSLGNTYSIINGEITSGTGVLEKGFDYGITIAFGSVSTESGSYGVGQFSAYLSGLTKGTVYYYRAKIRYSGGWVYGVTKSFATKGSPSMYEFTNTGGDGDSQWTQSNNVTAQTFYPITSHSITSVWLPLKRVGTTPGTVYLDIKTTSNCTTLSCWCWPTGEPLATADLDADAITTSYQWWEFVFDEPVCLSSNTTYALVLRAPTGSLTNYVLWQWDSGGATGLDGNAVHSTDGGISWVTDCPADLLYEIWGEPCFEVISAKVFKSYTTSGDWLIVCHYKNFYPPYYDDSADVSQLFWLQLVHDSTVLAQNPVKQWGYMPGSIYLNSTMVSSFEWGHGYKVRIYGDFTPYPYMEYQLTAADWIGDDLIWLDRYCRSIAVLMEDFYSTPATATLAAVTVTLTENVAGKGLVLNENGGVLFDTGIPELSEVRPDLFLIISGILPYTAEDYAHTLQQSFSWQTRVGPQLTEAFTNAGNIFSVSGSTIGALFVFILFAVVVAFAFAPGHAIGAIAIAFPLLLIAFWIGVWPLVAMAVILCVVTFWLAWQIWLKGA